MHGKVEKAMPITAELTPRKIAKNISERIKKGKSSNKIIKNMSLTPLNIRSSDSRS